MQASPTAANPDRAPSMKISWWGFFAVIVVGGAATTLAEIARLFIVEPEALAQRCIAGDQSWQCLLRNWLVYGFSHNMFGIAAVIVGLLAVVSRWRLVAALAIVCGVTGAALYRYELSGVGIVLGALTLVSAPNRSADGRRTEG